MGKVMTVWYEALTFLKDATTVLVIGLSLVAILAVLYFSIFKIRKLNASLAIIVSTILSCFLMVPVITAFNNLLEKKVAGVIIDETKSEIQALRAQADRERAEARVRILERERLENQIALAKQSIQIEALTDNIKLLESAQLSVQSLEKILELALLESNFKQNLVRREPVTALEDGWGLRADYFYDEVLVIVAQDITAKFGVDLTRIKVAKSNEDTVVVSGISPKFIGISNLDRRPILNEYRRLDFKHGNIDRVTVRREFSYNNIANAKAAQFESEYMKRLYEGLEFSFMDNAIIQLAQNFLTVILAPLYKNIKFEEIERAGALPLMEHLRKELKDSNEKIEELILLNGQGEMF
ncbi:MAG: hypothetical protein LBI06_07760 [Treponema sp.]|jgi:hypothetical protein|nr:hypothetical protein [Treponema sp.]